MSRFAYVNGRFVRHGEAAVHIEDRGYQLADGVYEVWAVFDGKLADAEGHFARLWRSLDELRIAHPLGEGKRRMSIPLVGGIVDRGDAAGLDARIWQTL